MSIPVDLADLARVLDEHGPGYLLTTGQGRVKAVTVTPQVQGDVLVLPPSRGSARNLSDQPAATLLFPPRVERGYTLLVDGTGTADSEDGNILFAPESAVLHRPSDHADGSDAPPPPAGVGDQTGCDHDCRPV